MLQSLWIIYILFAEKLSLLKSKNKHKYFPFKKNIFFMVYLS